MDFIKGFIGILPAGGETPDPAPAPPASGLYLNDLPGISTEFLEDLANPETADASGVWDKIQRRAWERLKTEALLLVSESRNFKTSLFTYSHFSPVYPVAYAPAPAEEDPEVFSGIVFTGSASDFREVRLRAISFIAKEAKDAVKLRVFDLMNGSELFADGSITFDAKKGINRVTIGKPLEMIFPTAPLFFIGISSKDLQLAPLETLFAPSDPCSPYSVNMATIQANELGGIYGSAITYPSDPAPGIGIEIEVFNSLEKYVERNPAPFKEAILYLVGVETLKEKLASPRQNYNASGNIVRTEATLEEYERDFKKALRVAMQSVTLEPGSYDVANQNGYTYGIGTLLT